MKRTTIFIEEGVERDLKALAERENRSAASVVREAIGEYLARRPGARNRLGFVAAGRSGRADTAERHEELLWNADDSEPSERSPTAEERGPADSSS